MSVIRQISVDALRAAAGGVCRGPVSNALGTVGSTAPASANPEVRVPPFHFVNVTWGDGHTGLYLDVSLPSQLSPGNLQVFRGRAGTLYKIYTTKSDAQRIRQSPAYLRLCELVPTQLIEIKIDRHAPNHEALTECQKKAIIDAEQVGAAVVFLAPDTVLADGGCASLLRLATEGKRAVMVAGVRLNKETFVPAFLYECRSQRETEVTISPRDLVALAVEHLHPISKSLLWPPRSIWPSHLYWLVDREGLLGRCYHLHPMMVVTSAANVSFSSTIDGDYVWNACRDDEVHVVEDSDELTLFEISPESYEIGKNKAPRHARAVGRWAALHTNPLHQRMIQNTIRFHRRDLSPEWQRIQAESDFVVHSIYCRMRAWGWFERLVESIKPAYRRVRNVARYLMRVLSSGISRVRGITVGGES